MIISLEEVKLYLRLDNLEEDSLIEPLIGAAEAYLKNATGMDFDRTNHLARLFCLILIADWYDNRGLTVGKVGDEVRPIIDSILAQLSYCYPEVPE